MNLFAPNHLILIALVVLLLFGGKKIPELMRGIGKGMREFTNAKDNKRSDAEEDSTENERPAKTRAVPPSATHT